MKIQHINLYNVSKQNFKGAALNINSFSDSHGNLDKLDPFYLSIEDNKDELFLDNRQGNKNVQIIAGDWFISGGTKGYASSRNANSHFFQIQFFNAFVDKIKELVAEITHKKSPETKEEMADSEMPVYFLVGNHELDGGAEELKRVVNSINAKILMTNLDVQNSPVLAEEVASNKILSQDILEIEDDKNPNLKHKALFLGISPVNMPYYAKGVKGITFLDAKYKSEKLLSPDDYQRTFDDTIKRIEQFKKENPKGLVILSCHTGANFAENLAEKLGDKINIVFDGHEHRDETKTVNGVKIVKLSQNFKKYVNAKFFIDDEGNLKDDVQIKSYYPLEKPKINGFFAGFYNGIFSKDLTKDLS